jgi:hypothetical protein
VDETFETPFGSLTRTAAAWHSSGHTVTVEEER